MFQNWGKPLPQFVEFEHPVRPGLKHGDRQCVSPVWVAKCLCAIAGGKPCYEQYFGKQGQQELWLDFQAAKSLAESGRSWPCLRFVER